MSVLPSVIIAEPDPMISSVLRVEFTHWDFAVFLAASGPEAETYAAQTVAHLIVLDTKLHLATYDACARIRRSPGYAVRPIVLTANEASPKVRAVASAAGATVVLPKPYSVTDLVNAVRPYLPPDDPLFAHRIQPVGAGKGREWPRPSAPNPQSGDDTARTGRLLPIVPGRGISIPFIRKP
jgi:DNA-binding response OmpR family regulator